ncbi:SAM-dependent DNA methyltransferase (plasmid) [Paenibacillus thiaminolyticus]|uniref:SAM-dependent DNA methyltransferase n=1 Tax=Paenibacillus thiaminolyticus TaxID=49283 RepID=UPI00232DEC1C|nr:SAM-dependent DNA methyltransferase [Paenibacillus thiaminolyticus]WCF11423.1 SAM-dependent DNA methyltransferase [Paenibacillus thiaminolyticus]
MNINKLLGISDSYQAPAQLMKILYDRKKREELFMEFLEAFNFDVSYDWFHDYFQNEHADRKRLKQDFTPVCVADLLISLVVGKGTAYDCAAGTGGITIRKWQSDRLQTSPFEYKPSEYLYVCEELSDRAIPFLLFNTLIRGMNAIIIHCDVLSRDTCGVFFVQNDKDDHMQFSSLNVMPYSQGVADFLCLKFVEERYKPLVESKGFPQHLIGGDPGNEFRFGEPIKRIARAK